MHFARYPNLRTCLPATHCLPVSAERARCRAHPALQAGRTSAHCLFRQHNAISGSWLACMRRKGAEQCTSSIVCHCLPGILCSMPSQVKPAEAREAADGGFSECSAHLYSMPPQVKPAVDWEGWDAHRQVRPAERQQQQRVRPRPAQQAPPLRAASGMSAHLRS